ncbi:MAG: hypothetical protein JW803_05025 [Endomicrobiales bacterium]|nr:hypothetical protein [Endomicrobiales bacterium]
MCKYSLKFIIGMIFLLTNNVVGWSGLAAGAYFMRRTGKKLFMSAGTFVYAVSWAMLLAGAYLVGPDGVCFARELLKKHRIESFIVFSLIIIAASFYVIAKRKKVYAIKPSGQV